MRVFEEAFDDVGQGAAAVEYVVAARLHVVGCFAEISGQRSKMGTVCLLCCAAPWAARWKATSIPNENLILVEKNMCIMKTGNQRLQRRKIEASIRHWHHSL